jgi:hypothetical protein
MKLASGHLQYIPTHSCQQVIKQVQLIAIDGCEVVVISGTLNAEPHSPTREALLVADRHLDYLLVDR